jgi:hypothetical protein
MWRMPALAAAGADWLFGAFDIGGLEMDAVCYRELRAKLLGTAAAAPPAQRQ